MFHLQIGQSFAQFTTQGDSAEKVADGTYSMAAFLVRAIRS